MIRFLHLVIPVFCELSHKERGLDKGGKWPKDQ